MSDTAEIDFPELIERVAIHLFGPPNPKHSKPGNPRWGTNGSLSIDTREGHFLRPRKQSRRWLSRI